MKKLILFALVGLLIALIAAALIALASINGLAKNAIESRGTFALGSRTTVSSVNVGLLSGRFSLSGLKVANPTGGENYVSPHFLSLGDGGVAVSLSTLRQPVVELPHLTLETLEVYLEKKSGHTNYAAILDHLKKTTGGGDKPAADERRYIVRDLDLQNITIHADLIGGPGPLNELTKASVLIERIQLTDVGKTGEGGRGPGVTLTELAGIIVKAVLAAASEKGSGIIPAELLEDLKGKLAAFTDLNKFTTEVVGGVMKTVDDLGKKAVDEGKKKIDEAAEKLKELIPEKK